MLAPDGFRVCLERQYRQNEFAQGKVQLPQAAEERVQIYRLRPLSLDLVPTLAEWFEDLVALSLFDRRSPVPLSAESLRESWRSVLSAPEPRTEHWFYLQNADEKPVGLSGITELNYAQGNAVVPLFIVSSQRGRGLGLRCLALLLDIAFDQLRLARITMFHREDNHASGALMRACGFTEEGRMRRAAFAHGRFMDRVIYGQLAEEWRNHRTALKDGLKADIVVTLGENDSSVWRWPPLLDEPS